MKTSSHSLVVLSLALMSYGAQAAKWTGVANPSPGQQLAEQLLASRQVMTSSALSSASLASSPAASSDTTVVNPTPSGGKVDLSTVAIPGASVQVNLGDSLVVGIYSTYRVVGIATNASSVTIPSTVTHNGRTYNLSEANFASADWSLCPNLTALTLGENFRTVQGPLTGSKITDLTYLHSSPYTPNQAFRPGEYRTLRIHVPFGTNYSYRYEDAVVLMGDMQPDYPTLNNSNYVQKLDDNNYLGYQISGSNGAFTAELRAVRLEAASLVVPDTVYAGVPVVKIGFHSYQTAAQKEFAQPLESVRQVKGSTPVAYQDYHAPNLKEITMPASVNDFSINYSSTQLETLHLKHTKQAPNSGYHVPSYLTVYVAGDSLLKAMEKDSRWNSADLLPEGFQPVAMTIDIQTPGEFAQKYLEATGTDWGKVNHLKVTGKPDETDFTNINKLTRLYQLDLSELEDLRVPNQLLTRNQRVREVLLPAHVTFLGDEAFYMCPRLERVTFAQVENVANPPAEWAIGLRALAECPKLVHCDLPEGLVSINYQAFEGCTALRQITLPQSLKTLRYSAFEGAGLESVIVPDQIKEIEESTFESCRNLTAVKLPASIHTIENSAFSNCSNLLQLTLPDSLEKLGHSVFSGTGIREITLPARLHQVGSSLFYNCKELRKIYVLSAQPPYLSSGSLFDSYMSRDSLHLYVPSVAIPAYRQANGWKDFYFVHPLNQPVGDMSFYRPFTMHVSEADSLTLKDNPNLMLGWKGNNEYGQLTIKGQEGTEALSLGNFKLHAYHQNGSSWEGATLINELPAMRADSVALDYQFDSNEWYFISFPFNVKVKDILVGDSTYWTIREYDGAMRAQGNFDLTWKYLQEDSELQAGKGYILQARVNWDGFNPPRPHFVFRAANDTRKNDLFAAHDVKVPLTEHLADFAQNRSWNLVGNPYPAFFNLNFTDFLAPVTVWNGYSYEAVSPIDDNYLLKPNEAFFVQRPVDQDGITFQAKGRMHYDEAKNFRQGGGFSVAREGLRETAAQRLVFNFELADAEGRADKTRIVLNEGVTMAYDLERDASKMLSSDATMHQLYSLQGGVQYAINERPYDDGTAQLEATFAQAGTYTLRLASATDEGCAVTLIDKWTGNTVRLTAEGYRFEAEAGVAKDRFTLSFGEPTAIEEVETDAEVRATTDGLHIRAAKAVHIQVYAADGRLCYSQQTKQAQIDLPAGVYLVKVDGQVQKVQVK